jgi:hypothetical protein
MNEEPAFEVVFGGKLFGNQPSAQNNSQIFCYFLDFLPRRVLG